MLMVVSRHNQKRYNQVITDYYGALRMQPRPNVSSLQTMPNDASHPRADNGDIDLVEIIALAWRGKLWILSGIVLGVTTALSVLQVKNPPVYVLKLPVLLEGGDAVLNKDFINDFNRSPADFYGSLSQHAAELVKQLNDHGMNIDRFTRRQDGALGDRHVPYKLIETGGPGSNSFTLELRLPLPSTAVSPDNLALATTASLMNAVTRRRNSDAAAAQLNASASNPPLTPAEQLRQLELQRFSEWMTIRLQVEGLIADLGRRLKGLGMTAPAGLSREESLLWLLGAFAAHSQIPDPEKAQVNEKFTALRAALSSIKLRFENPLHDAELKLQEHFDQANLQASLVPLDKINLRVVAPSNPSQPGTLLETSWTKESKQPFFGSVGVVVGALAGFTGYLIATFFIRHWRRLRQMTAR